MNIFHGIVSRCLGVATLLILVVGCGGDGSPITAERKNIYYEHELNDTLRAYPENTVILELESTDTAALKGSLIAENAIRNTIPYEYRRDENFIFCLGDDEPHITSVQLFDNSGNEIVSIKKGECANRTIKAGKYEMKAYHDGSGIDKEALAFVHISNTVKLPLSNSGSWAVRAENGKMLSAEMFGGDTYFTVLADSTSVGEGNLFNVITDSNGVYFSAFSDNQFLADSLYGIVVLMKDDKPFSAYNTSLNSGFKLILNDMGSYSFHYIIEYTDYYGKLQDHCLYTYTGNVNTLMESGNGCNPYSSQFPANSLFTVAFRFFTDGTRFGQLQEGEVALFENCNQTGRAWVFAADTADFGALSKGINQLNDNISFVKPGPDTTAILYSNSQYSGSSQTIGEDTCLKGSVVGDKAASSLKIFYSKQVLISSSKCENCNLAGVDLSGLSLNSVDVANANLSGANLTNADMSSAILTGANLSGATIAGTNLQAATMYCTDFSNVDFTSLAIKFDADPLIKKDFSCRTSLRGSTLSANVIKPQIWRFLDLSGANIIGSNGKDLNGTDLSNIDLSGIMLAGVNLTGVKLDGAKLGCDTTYSVCSNLTNVQLNNASLKKTDLNNAVMCGANLNFSNLEGANLYKAFLNGSGSSGNIAARFTGAFLKNANLSNANMSGADFSNASLFSDSSGTCQGGNRFLTACASAQYADMNSVNFSGAYLNGLDMSNSTPQGAAFTNAMLSGAKLIGANISNDPTTARSTDFTGAYLQGADFTSLVSSSGAIFTSSYVDISSPPGGRGMYFLINFSNTLFNGYWKINAHTCASFSYSGQTTLPKTDNTVVCPDGSSGACSNNAWNSPQVTMSQDTAQPASYSTDNKPVCSPDGYDILYW